MIYSSKKVISDLSKKKQIFWDCIRASSILDKTKQMYIPPIQILVKQHLLHSSSLQVLQMNQNPHQWPSQVFHVVAPHHLPVKHQISSQFPWNNPKQRKKKHMFFPCGNNKSINKILTLIGLRFFQKIEWFTWPARW